MYLTRFQLTLAVCGLVLLSGGYAIPAAAEVVTVRLGTGLPPTHSRRSFETPRKRVQPASRQRRQIQCDAV